MADLEKPTLAQLSSALTVQEKSLRNTLSTGDLSTLVALTESLLRRYPGQDQEESVLEYQKDYERLAMVYSVTQVQQAVAALRIKPDQKFFPRPDEVAAQIERDRAGDYFKAMEKSAQSFMDQVSRWRHQWESQDEREWRISMGYEKAEAQDDDEAA